MAPHADDCEERERLSYDVPVHQGRRILPGGALPAPAHAWTEAETDRLGSPGESRRLLGPAPPPTKLEGELTLGVAGIAKNRKITQIHLGKPKVKTKLQKRKEKLFKNLKPPYFVLTMIVLITCVHLRTSCLPAVGQALEWRPGGWWRQPWRLLSYSLVHATPAHLAINALVAFVVCWWLEREQGWWRAGAVWAGGAAGGALGTAALQPEVHMVGASAAVYALLTAHVSNVLLRYGHIPLWWFRPLSVVVLCVSEGAWTARAAGGGAGSGAGGGHGYNNSVAWSAHLIGAAVGVPLALLVFTGENRDKLPVIVCRALSVVVLTAGAVAAALATSGAFTNT